MDVAKTKELTDLAKDILQSHVNTLSTIVTKISIKHNIWSDEALNLVMSRLKTIVDKLSELEYLETTLRERRRNALKRKVDESDLSPEPRRRFKKQKRQALTNNKNYENSDGEDDDNWNRTSRGRSRLTSEVLRDTIKKFQNLTI